MILKISLETGGKGRVELGDGDSLQTMPLKCPQLRLVVCYWIMHIQTKPSLPFHPLPPFCVLEMEPWASHMLGKHSTTELP